MVTHTGIDTNQAPPLQQQQTLAAINQWCVQATAFLNRFSALCQHRLTSVDERLQRTEDQLRELEAKLSSVPEVEPAPSSAGPQAVETEDKNVEKAAEDVKPQDEGPPLREHPAYAPFLRMVAVGVPEAAVRLKMEAEGLDPSVLSQ